MLTSVCTPGQLVLSFGLIMCTVKPTRINNLFIFSLDSDSGRKKQLLGVKAPLGTWQKVITHHTVLWEFVHNQLSVMDFGSHSSLCCSSVIANKRLCNHLISNDKNHIIHIMWTKQLHPWLYPQEEFKAKALTIWVPCHFFFCCCGKRDQNFKKKKTAHFKTQK